MTNKFVWFCLLVCVGFSACETDFTLEGEWRDIPVVYGFISLQDTAHYIRVEKAFLEPGGNAEDVAQIADSLYYENATVQLIKENGQAFTLERVDGNLEGYQRQDGPFATAPNFLYKIKKEVINLEGGETIQLLVNRGDDLPPVTAETIVISDIIPNENSPASPMNWEYNRFVTTAWNVTSEARIFDVRYIFNYRENSADAPTVFEERSVEWVVVNELLREDEPTTTRVSISPQGESFYRFLGANIPPAENQVRLLSGVDILISGGGEELVEQIEILRVNSGITSSQVIPTYTNLSEGFGLFTSRVSVLRTNLQLNAVSADSLRNGIYTKDLNFVQ
ncbi:MAG: hypothetical protein AAF798_09160 [Bacteroidota bacterium]